MAVELSDLLEALESSLNVPGETGLFDFATDEDPWLLALANGFWWASIKGFYPGYRVDDDFNIVNTDLTGDDLSRTDQQIIVLSTALTALENKMLTMYSSTHDKAGPVESDRQRSTTLLRALLEGRRQELQDLKDQIIGGAGRTSVQVIDAVLTRSGYFDNYLAAGAAWIR